MMKGYDDLDNREQTDTEHCLVELCYDGLP